MSNEPRRNEDAGHVLVVDDYPMNRMTLSRLLEQLGHTFATAENGLEALEKMHTEPFDVVLLDIVMPEMDGFAVLQRLKSDSKLRDIPVIVISAVEEIDSVVKCIEMGAEDFLPKPFNPTLLKARLRTSLQKKKLRDLEKAYLQQEIMLRQSEKLATLGKLSAGLAHELNNPAAAAKRSGEQLRSAVESLERNTRRLFRSNLSESQLESLETMVASAQTSSMTIDQLDPVARSDRASDVEGWLEDQGIENAWEYAPVLASIGLDPGGMDAMLEGFEGDLRPAALSWFCANCEVHWLLNDIGVGIERIVDLVSALKTYSFMDQAPVQEVDLHQGLKDTLTMLRARLSEGVAVRREYAPDLPRIPAHGSELNQVWTNLIDNAIDAMQGHGTLVVRTRLEDDWVVVEVEDSGSGIPEDVQPRMFDPFFTTKAPGSGTGLGLNITHNIVVQKHGGRIEARSRPGSTVFEVRLPMHSLPEDRPELPPAKAAA